MLPSQLLPAHGLPKLTTAERQSFVRAVVSRPLAGLQGDKRWDDVACLMSPVVTKVTADYQVTVLHTPNAVGSKSCGKKSAFQFKVISTPVPIKMRQDLLPRTPKVPTRTISDFSSYAACFDGAQPASASAYAGVAGRRQAKLDERALYSPNPIKRLMKGLESLHRGGPIFIPTLTSDARARPTERI